MSLDPSDAVPDGRTAGPPRVLVVRDVAAWRAWLDAHESTSDGVWLTLAKKGTTAPTTLTYAEALQEALCSGWIDGRRRAGDAATFRQHLTPRRARSPWSRRNVELVAALTAAGRMRPRGRREVERAQADGRWERAYAGQATATTPDDLAAALAAAPPAAQRFAALGRGERYAAIHRVLTAPTAATRRARVAAVVARLAPGDRAGLDDGFDV